MKKYLMIAAAIVAPFWAQSAIAQAAAESAIIQSGTGQATGASSRALGGASSSAINRATGAIEASRGGARRSGTGTAAGSTGRSGRSDNGAAGYRIAGNIDALERFSVPTYRLGNGSYLKVSGILLPNSSTTCIENCP